ncbi:MAG: HD domain-containing protein [Blastocatellia bacterium]
MNADVLSLCEAMRAAGGRAMLVGGWVRDRLLGIDSKDFDIEVYGLEPQRLREVLEQIGQVNTVGEHFSVYKLVSQSARFIGSQTSSSTDDAERIEIDVSLPRRESKSGRGHRGFVIEGDPGMSFEDAARRRDFTINAILYDPLSDETLDPFGGKKDLRLRILRAVSADTFIEDSLRVLRAVQLAARFEMTIDPATRELCLTIELSDLPRERIWGEIEKLLTLAEHPSIGLQAALELEVLTRLFPEIHALVGWPQDDTPLHEDVFAHTKRSMDEAVKLAGDLSKAKRIAVVLATLCHELGKPLTRSPVDSVSSKDHDKRVVELTRPVLNKLGLHSIGGYDVRSQVLELVREHGKPNEFYQSAETTDGDFRRLAQRVDLDLVYRVAKACSLGAGSDPTAEDWFIRRARALGVDHGPLPPLLQGRHLLEAGFEPGPQMGRVLRRVYELQMDGEVTNLADALAAAGPPVKAFSPNEP